VLKSLETGRLTNFCSFLIYRLADYPPPALIVVMGPKGCGKSTLIRSLVKLFTGQNLSSTTGPITCVAGRHRRVTFFECPNDIFSMTDLSKVADLVLLMVDASYGFEMETFEFLNQLQLHGFPKVVGVLTHLDGFKMNKSLQKTKKALKHRFWTEIYDGAKMFDMSGVVNGKYPKHEVKRISLYISRTKFRPLVWRNTHPYVVVDRVEDVTPQQRLIAAAADGTSAECDRDVTLYGYVRGTHLHPHHRVHLIGVGDFPISGLSSIEDPCHQPGVPGGGDLQEKATLKKKDNLLYAPLANVGRVKIDSDGVYIELKTVHYTKKENLVLGDSQGRDEYGDAEEGAARGNTPADLLRSMQDASFSLDQRMEDSEMSLFKGSAGVKSSSMKAESNQEEDEGEGNFENDEYDEVGDDDEDNDDYDENEDDDDEDEDDEDEDVSMGGTGMEEDEDEDEDEEGNIPSRSTSASLVPSSTQWKVGMQEKAASSFTQRAADARAKALGGKGDIMHTVYGAGWSSHTSSAETVDSDGESDDADDDNDDLFVAVKSSSLEKYRTNNCIDTNRLGQKQRAAGGNYYSAPTAASTKTAASSSSSPASSLFFQTLRRRFVTGGSMAWNGAGTGGGSKKKTSSGTGEDEDETEVDGDGGDDDDSVYGDFEDLQQTDGDVTNGGSDSEGEDGEDEDDDSDVDSEADNDAIDKQLRDSYALKKSAAKSSFDKDYDTKKSKGKGKGKGKVSR
jgi:ribosome biogenesis protein BMS1